jgi:hypothetical protein
MHRPEQAPSPRQSGHGSSLMAMPVPLHSFAEVMAVTDVFAGLGRIIAHVGIQSDRRRGERKRKSPPVRAGWVQRVL